MKKTLLLSMLMLAGFTASAQLPNGTVAPDFTATDINGNTHTLSEYLAQGKTVILDVSATWCAPCWSFHSSHALSDLHYSYGPAGTEDVVVIFVEGDPNTSVSSLYGVNTNTDTSITRGNWAAGTPYPIIDSGEIADLYQINYFPTLYRICPNGIVTEIEPALAPDLISSVNTGCGQLEAPQNHALVTTEGARVCETTGNLKANFKNYGQNAITSATFVIKENGTAVSTQEFTGNVAAFAKGEVLFSDVNFNAGSEYTVEATAINSASPLTWWMAAREFNVTATEQVSNNIVVNVYTDSYPGEISWRIKDSNGTVVFTGGPYVGAAGGAAGGPDANTTKTHNVTLPDGVDCYSLELLDAYGDGWSWGNAVHGIEIFTSEGSAFYHPAGDFGSSLEIESVIKSSGALSNAAYETQKFTIYPNPSNGIFTFNTAETVSITVSDITGKTVYTGAGIENGMSIDLSNLQSGVYLAKVAGASSERVEKLIIR